MVSPDPATTVTNEGQGSLQRPAVDGHVAPPERIGRYRIERLLGKGGFGSVYLSHDEQLGRAVAIKVPNADLVSCPEDVEQYLNEARIVASLDHPAIVPVHDAGATSECPFFVVMKHIEGTDLAGKMRQGRASYGQAARLVATIADALHYAHTQGLVHRDVKPGNILIDGSGKPYLADFGLALHERKVGQGSRRVGTPAYMSPEQARGEGHRVDGRSDIFSLGAVFYELLTGRRPFFGETHGELIEQIKIQEPKPPRQIEDGVPKELERICLKALAKRAGERYTTARDMADELAQFLNASPEVAFAPGMAAASDLAAARLDTSRNNDTPQPAPTPSSDRLSIVPKGLRSFDEQDADFFLELLPGPKDRQGLPDSLRFWKLRIEETDPDRTFCVGLIYGPSGCGKSSLVKAGLLPRLSKTVRAIYLEATPDDTEAKLLVALRKQFAALANEPGLTEAMAALRRSQAFASETKVLIVLDQFEQWLQAQHQQCDPELVCALRQCDGQRVQCILLVRDDFWLAVSRFMLTVEVDLVPGRNIALVDVFDLDHARRVLAAYGRSFGRLPERLCDETKEQSLFLNQAVRGLAEDAKVVCVRLALFAEMMKDKPWTSASLKQLGGTTGVGVAFLEESFSSPRANPKHRRHQSGAGGVLKALLPQSGSDIRGRMRSYGELLEASTYSSPREFDELLRILDGEIRLITPVDPEGVDAGAACCAPEGRRSWFQLSHDYLVPSLREWLTRKQKETWRGRSELRLAERSGEWSARPENRHLPGLCEYLDIHLFARSGWTQAQRQMMQRATRVHAMRALSVVAGALLVGVVALVLSQRPTDWESFTDARRSPVERLRAFNRLQLADDTSGFKKLVRALEDERDGEVLTAAISRIAAHPTADFNRDAAQRAEWTDFLRGLVAERRRSAMVRLAAFDALRLMTTDTETLEVVRGQIDPQNLAIRIDSLLRF